MRQEIRIIGGQYRGKKISFPNQQDLRPTPDRVRETLFNWLMQDIRDARCLDAFAGSGALGFEAFSRGAKQVVFVEYSNIIYQHLKRHLKNFNSPRLTLIHAHLNDFLSKTADDTFDIVFYDPPFSNLTWYEKPLKEIARVLRSNGLLYLESPKEIQLEPCWKPLKLKTAGQVTYGLYLKT